MKRIVSFATCLAVMMSSIVFVYAENNNYTDYIDIGNAESEQGVEYSNASEIQINTVDGVEHTYRTLGKNGYMTFTVNCDPDNTNYLTVKLWGNDTGSTMLWLVDNETNTMSVDGKTAPMRNGIVDRNDWVELNFLGDSPQYNGGFIYSTYIVPKAYTEGKNEVTLKIYSTGGNADYADEDSRIQEQTISSRGIYAIYMTQEANFKPSKYEQITGSLAETAQITAKSYSEQKALALEYSRNAVDTFKSWQIYGQDNYPSYMEGMITRTMGWRTKDKDDSDWKDAYYTTGRMLKQNMTPLNGLEVFATAYKNADELGYNETEKTELLDRIIAGVDFLVRAQGANGEFFSNYGWIGGPERISGGGNNLTGFGLRSAAEAIVMTYDDINKTKELGYYMDADGDGSIDTTSRKKAWENMITSARDYLVSLDGAGHAPNQDMADIIAALRFNKALKMMNSSSAWEQSEIINQLDIALGFKPNISTSSYWVSPKGLILENFGSIKGGYSGDYGINALEEMSQLAEIAEDCFGKDSDEAKKYSALIDKAYAASDNFMFTANASVGGNPTLYSEGLTSNRNAYYPGTERYVLDIYAALDRGSKTSLKTFENFLKHDKLTVESEKYTPSNAHFEDNALSVMRLYLNFDEIEEKLGEVSNYNYLMENDSIDEYAWADEMGRNVVIKNGEDKIYIALNWRNPIHSTSYYNTYSQQNRQSGLMNNLARIHHKTDSYDKYGYAEMATIGWNVKTADDMAWQTFANHYAEAFMYMSYGDYVVIMNSNNLMKHEKNISYDIPYIELGLNGLYKDLISGRTYYFGESVENAEDGTAAHVAPASTMVLYKTLPEGEVQISDVTYTDNIVTVTASANEDEAAPVTVYAAEYNPNKALVNIKQKVKTIYGEDKITFNFTKTSPDNKVKIFVWDRDMNPLYNAQEW